MAIQVQALFVVNDVIARHKITTDAQGKIVQLPDQQYTVSAYLADDPINKAFVGTTPNGRLELTFDDPPGSQFTIGGSLYVTLTDQPFP